MLLHPGVQQQLINEAPTAAGTTSKEISVQSDTILVTLWVQSVTSDLTVTVWSFTDDARTRKEVSIVFPTVSAPTTRLLLRRAAITTARTFVEAVYSGSCEYEIHVRAIEAGLVETRVTGAANLRMSQVDVPSGVPTVLIPASLTDRAGLVIRNWSATGNVYIGATSGQASISAGYPLSPKESLGLDVQAGVAIYAVAETSTVDIRISEAGG